MRQNLPFYALLTASAAALALIAAGASVDASFGTKATLIVIGVVAITVLIGIAAQVSLREMTLPNPRSSAPSRPSDSIRTRSTN